MLGNMDLGKGGPNPTNDSEQNLNCVPPSAHIPGSVESEPLQGCLAEAAVPGEDNRASTSISRMAMEPRAKQRIILIGEHPLTKFVNEPNAGLALPADSHPMLASNMDMVGAGRLLQEQQVDFVELEDGTLVEMIEDPHDPANRLLAIYKDGAVQCARNRTHRNRVLVPIGQEDRIFTHVGLARGTRPYGYFRLLMDEIASVIRHCVEMDENDLLLVAAFVVSTWFIELLAVAPYLALVGPPRSGKTTLLRVLSLLCRRALLTSDISSAAFYEVYEKLTPTLLVDETLTAANNRVFFHLLKTGTTRGLVTFRKGRSFKAFGPKVISWTELPNDPALNSRCVIISMQETTRTDLARPTDKWILDAADILRMRLLQCRFENYKSLSLPKIERDERLHSRTRDLYQALALPFGRDADLCGSLVRLFEDQQEINREPLPPAAIVVLRALYEYIHAFPKRKKCANKDLTETVNSQLDLQGETYQLNAHEVGRALTSLGLTNRKRTNEGYVLCLDQRTKLRIHNLVHNYGIDQESQFLGLDLNFDCQLCKNLRPLNLPTETKGDR